jgi:hypothetical protein
MAKNMSIVLKAADHADYTVSETTDWRFAQKEMTFPLEAAETPQASREYALFFRQGKPGIHALVGIEPGVNVYVGANGSWQADYIPARLRAHPFLLASAPASSKDFFLALKNEAPEVNNGAGHRVFINGVLSDFSRSRAALLSRIQRGSVLTQKIVAAIRSCGLLEDVRLNINFSGGERRWLSGLQKVSEEKLNALPEESFLSLRNIGALKVIYAHLMSLNNLQRGPLMARYPELVRGAEKKSGSQAPSDIVELD